MNVNSICCIANALKSKVFLRTISLRNLTLLVLKCCCLRYKGSEVCICNSSCSFFKKRTQISALNIFVDPWQQQFVTSPAGGDDANKTRTLVFGLKFYLQLTCHSLITLPSCYTCTTYRVHREKEL